MSFTNVIGFSASVFAIASFVFFVYWRLRYKNTGSKRLIDGYSAEDEVNKLVKKGVRPRLASTLISLIRKCSRKIEIQDFPVKVSDELFGMYLLEEEDIQILINDELSKTLKIRRVGKQEINELEKLMTVEDLALFIERRLLEK